jgi:uncharacterized protein (DUF2147 family)
MTFLQGTAAVAAATLMAMTAPASAGSGPFGIWAMSNGKVTVQVTECGPELCGTIVRLKEPISKIDGKPKIDRENPDPALRRRPLLGLAILIGMKAAGNKKWKGAIYNPDDGKTYSATVKLDGDTMKVQGCVLGVLCKTNDFVRTN